MEVGMLNRRILVGSYRLLVGLIRSVLQKLGQHGVVGDPPVINDHLIRQTRCSREFRSVQRLKHPSPLLERKPAYFSMMLSRIPIVTKRVVSHLVCEDARDSGDLCIEIRSGILLLY